MRCHWPTRQTHPDHSDDSFATTYLFTGRNSWDVHFDHHGSMFWSPSEQHRPRIDETKKINDLNSCQRHQRREVKKTTTMPDVTAETAETPATPDFFSQSSYSTEGVIRRITFVMNFVYACIRLSQVLTSKVTLNSEDVMKKCDETLLQDSE